MVETIAVVYEYYIIQCQGIREGGKMGSHSKTDQEGECGHDLFIGDKERVN